MDMYAWITELYGIDMDVSALLSEIIGAMSDLMKRCINFILRWSCRTYGGQYSSTYCAPFSDYQIWYVKDLG